MNMKKILGIILFLGICANIDNFAQITPSQVQRTHEILEKEKALREKIEKEEKVFIKRIVVEGASLLSKDEIDKIILPFQRHWLSKEDIQQIINLLIQTYNQKGYDASKVNISYEIKKRQLIIEINEQ